MFCRNCGQSVDPIAHMCVKCGVLLSAGRGYCGHCGKPHDPAADFCTACGAGVGSSVASAAGSSFTGAANTAFAFTAQAPGNAIPEDVMQRWSWGGFLLVFFWPLWNANVTLKWLTLGALIVGIFTLGLPGLALGIYYGINGNRIAARDRRFASVAEYVAVQRAWAKAGVIVLLVGFPLSIMLSFCAAIMSTIANHPVT